LLLRSIAQKHDATPLPQVLLNKSNKQYPFSTPDNLFLFFVRPKQHQEKTIFELQKGRNMLGVLFESRIMNATYY
jgi:hypothetical protein